MVKTKVTGSEGTLTVLEQIPVYTYLLPSLYFMLTRLHLPTSLLTNFRASMSLSLAAHLVLDMPLLKLVLNMAAPLSSLVQTHSSSLTPFCAWNHHTRKSHLLRSSRMPAICLTKRISSLISKISYLSSLKGQILNLITLSSLQVIRTPYNQCQK